MHNIPLLKQSMVLCDELCRMLIKYTDADSKANKRIVSDSEYLAIKRENPPKLEKGKVKYIVLWIAVYFVAVYLIVLLPVILSSSKDLSGIGGFVLIAVGIGSYAIPIVIAIRIKKHFINKQIKQGLLEYQKSRYSKEVARAEAIKLRDTLKAQLGEKIEYVRNPTNCCIPEKYWTKANIINQYITDGRADSIKEAINLFESEITWANYSSMLDEISNQMYDQSMDLVGIRSALEGIENNTRWSIF